MIQKALLAGSLTFFLAQTPDQENEYRYLWLLEVDAAEVLDLEERPLTISLFGDKAESWANLLSDLQNVEIERGPASVDLSIAVKNPQFAGEPQDRHLAASWIVDFDQPSVQEVVDRLPSEPSLEDLLRVTDEALPVKTNRRSWDLPSQVVRHGEGDCTEHALLLAALARARELPARVMLGMLFVDVEGDVGGFGHAWTEVWLGGRWQLADASWRGSPLTRFYLPATEVVNETASYAVHLFDRRVRPDSIQLSRSTPLTD